MRLPILLGALLIQATPGLANDFFYLKCNVTIKSTVSDWYLGMSVKESEQDASNPRREFNRKKIEAILKATDTIR